MLHHLPSGEVLSNRLSLLIKLDAEQAEIVVAGLCAIEREEREKAALAANLKLPGWRHLRAFRQVRADIAAELIRKIGAHIPNIANEVRSHTGRESMHTVENGRRRRGSNVGRARNKSKPRGRD